MLEREAKALRGRLASIGRVFCCSEEGLPDLNQNMSSSLPNPQYCSTCRTTGHYLPPPWYSPSSKPASAGLLPTRQPSNPKSASPHAFVQPWLPSFSLHTSFPLPGVGLWSSDPVERKTKTRAITSGDHRACIKSPAGYHKESKFVTKVVEMLLQKN